MIDYLDYVLSLRVFSVGMTTGRHYRGIFVKTTPCLWFEKGKRNPYNRIWDIDVSPSKSGKYSNFHKWQKGQETIDRWISAFSQPGAIVYDPFTGGGTVPAVCKMLGRNYVASEIDPTTAALARDRVANTQPPLFIPESEQMKLEL